MACVYGHGVAWRIIPAYATFCFLIMKPAIRMAAYGLLLSLFGLTMFVAGQSSSPAVEHGHKFLMEKLKNHSGKNSMLVLRPADSIECTDCYKLMMENQETPSAIILSRQNIKDLPTNHRDVAKGAYVVTCDGNPDVILVASGSEVSTLSDAADLLRAEGKRVRVVSVPSEGLFRSQSADYQEKILPSGVKKFGLTAGLPVNLEGLVGADGIVHGLESFGFSAPYKVLDENSVLRRFR